MGGTALTAEVHPGEIIGMYTAPLMKSDTGTDLAGRVSERRVKGRA